MRSAARAAETAIEFLDYLLASLPLRVDVIQTDNRGEFGTRFHRHVLDRGEKTQRASPLRGSA